MLNGINNYLSSQIGKNDEVNKLMTNPFNSAYGNQDKSLLVDESAISNTAVKMYQKDLDVRNFNQIAMSNPNDLSHNEKVAELFDVGVVDVYSDDMISDLAANRKLLEDLGF